MFYVKKFLRIILRRTLLFSCLIAAPLPATAAAACAPAAVSSSSGDVCSVVIDASLTQWLRDQGADSDTVDKVRLNSSTCTRIPDKSLTILF